MLDGSVPFPEETAERYRREGYWRGDTLGGLLRAWAERSGDAPAVVAGERAISYRELDVLADRLAVELLERGLAAPDRVMVHLGNVPEFLVVLFACARIGVLPVLALPAHREHELRPLTEFAEAAAYVTGTHDRDTDLQELAGSIAGDVPSVKHVLVVGDAVQPGLLDVRALLASDRDPAEARRRVEARAPDPSDIAFFLLSGGTTGLPKLIPRTHDDYSYNLRGSAEVAGIGADDVYLVALPIGHNFPLGCSGALGTLHAGGTVVLCGDPRPEAAFPLVARHGVTVTALVPALALRWLDAAEAGTDHDLSSLRLLQVGGARFTPEPARRVRPVLGCTLQQVFGMAEGLLNFTRPDDPEDVIVGTQGRPMSPADEVVLVDADGDPVPDGEPGELLTRGPYTIRGYFSAPEHDRRSFTPDGFYRSGDIVRWHPSGNLVVEGRSKDIINRGGENVSAEEVEDLVLAHPAVANAAAVAMPDPELGERICVYVVPRGDPPTLEELRAFLVERGVARFKLPERLEVVEGFPTTSVGKISKEDLRADLATKLEARR